MLWLDFGDFDDAVRKQAKKLQKPFPAGRNR